MDQYVTRSKIPGIVFMCFASALVFICYEISLIACILIAMPTLIVSIFFLITPAVVYNRQEIRINNLFGITRLTYRFEQDKIERSGSLILINGKPLKISTILLAKADYADLLNYIQANSIERKGLTRL